MNTSDNLSQGHGSQFRDLSWLNDERHMHRVLIGLLIIAFLLRLMAALIIPLEYRFRGDALEYIADARHLLTLGVFGEEPGIPYAIIPPGYPLFIAAIFAITNHSLMAVRLAQVALGTLMVWLSFLIGKQVGTQRSGLLAGSICALYPVFIIWPVFFLTETLYITLMLLFTWCLIESMKRGTAKYVIMTGVTFGLNLLIRETLFLFPLLLPFALWWSPIPWQKVWRYLLLFAITTLLVLAPWFMRNYYTFGQAFYTERIEAVRYRVTGSGYLSPAYQHLADANSPPPEEKYPGYYERYGAPGQVTSVSFALANPATYLRIIFNRLVETWLHPNGLESLPKQLIVQGVYVALHLLMLALASLGLFAGLSQGHASQTQRDRKLGVLILTWLLLYAAGTFLFFSAPNPRYTMPFLPLIFILAAMGIERIWRYSQRVGKSGTRQPAKI